MDTKLKPNAQVYALTKGKVEARTSRVVTGQLPITNLIAYTLVDLRVSHSYLAARLVGKIK